MKAPMLLAAMTAVLLSACATPTQYAPAAKPGGPGWTETQIENNRYRVSFRTAAGGPARASDMALLRAADLTLQNNYDWFTVDSRGTEAGSDDSGPRVSFGVGGGSYGGHTGVGVGIGTGFNLGQGNGGPATTMLEIRMGKNPKPQDAQAYDAREVQSSIRARIG